MLIRRLHTIAVLAVSIIGPFASAASASELPLWQRDPEVAGLLMPTAQTLIDATAATQPESTTHDFSPRAILTALASGLRDIRYRRGGREPETGFDCSGFVRYVFQHGIGVDLPANSAAQFQAGAKIDRDDLREGDLVFFRIGGKRISHVGIYMGDGRFIHAPSSGKRVSISALAETYWAKRFAGAKRPTVLADVDDVAGDDHG